MSEALRARYDLLRFDAAARRATGLRLGETPLGDARTLTPLVLARLAPARLICALALAAAALPAAAGPLLDVSPEVQARLGVRTQTLAVQQRSVQVAAFAKVLDPGPLSQLESDLDTAIAAAAASSAEAARARALSPGNTAMSAKDAEAAISQARQDEAKVALLRRQVGLQWGPGLARMSDARRQALVKALSEGRAALVQVDTPDSQGQAGARTVEIDIGQGSVHAPVIGPSRNAEPRLQSSGLIALVTGKDAVLFSIGLTQSARINQPSNQTGVLLPRSSLIRYEGLDWAYVRRGPGQFERRQVQAPTPEKDGDFVAQGFGRGEEIAVQGVAALFAAEQGAPRRGS